jgi:hypothetical protein
MSEDPNRWEGVYRSKEEAETSWFEDRPQVSLDLIAETGASKDAAIVDVGAGSSRLVDCLLDQGFRRITVLDLSETAFAHGARAATAGCTDRMGGGGRPALAALRPLRRLARSGRVPFPDRGFGSGSLSESHKQGPRPRRPRHHRHVRTRRSDLVQRLTGRSIRCGPAFDTAWQRISARQIAEPRAPHASGQRAADLLRAFPESLTGAGNRQSAPAAIDRCACASRMCWGHVDLM